jgi:hypothetical protein
MLKGVSVRGALSTMSAEDVLEWAAKRKLSAPITFERRGVTRSVVVEDGVVMWASSNRRDEQLGVILVRSGIVAERALADSLEARAETGVPLGKVLLMAGMISEPALVDILTTKIRETITDVVTWTEGTFEVVPRGQLAATGVSTPMAMADCLAIGRLRYARMSDVMAVLGSDDVTFYVPPSARPPDNAGELDQAKVWALAGDRHTAADIAAAFAGARFSVYDALAQMVSTDRLVIDRRHRERTNSAVELAAGARGRLRAGDRAGAFAMASQALHQDPSDAEVRKTFAQIERARVAEVAKQLLSRHRVPKRAKAPTADMGLTVAELELAARVDGRWDLLSLVRSANVREAEALLAFSRLAEAGVVELG